MGFHEKKKPSAKEQCQGCICEILLSTPEVCAWLDFWVPEGGLSKWQGRGTSRPRRPHLIPALTREPLIACCRHVDCLPVNTPQADFAALSHPFSLRLEDCPFPARSRALGRRAVLSLPLALAAHCLLSTLRQHSRDERRGAWLRYRDLCHSQLIPDRFCFLTDHGKWSRSLTEA